MHDERDGPRAVGASGGSIHAPHTASILARSRRQKGVFSGSTGTRPRRTRVLLSIPEIPTSSAARPPLGSRRTRYPIFPSAAPRACRSLISRGHSPHAFFLVGRVK